MSTFKEQVAPLGKMHMFNRAAEMKTLETAVNGEEIKAVAYGKLKKNCSLALTDTRLVISTQKNMFSADTSEISLSDITDIKKKEKLLVTILSITHNDRVDDFAILTDKAGKIFLTHFTPEGEEPASVPEKHDRKGAISLSIEIKNGHKTIDRSKYTKMRQTKAGEVFFTNLGLDDSRIYQYAGFDRVQNTKKSGMDTLGAAALGSLWGIGGVVAGSAAASQGKDTSNATIFLIDKKTREKVAIVIKCDSKVLGKLSLFIADQSGLDSQPNNDAEQLVKFKELLDQGVITQDDFDAKKKQILGI